MHEGQHPAIVDRELWDRVRQNLEDHLAAKNQLRDRQSTNALLVGKLFDDRGKPDDAELVEAGIEAVELLCFASDLAR